MKLFDLNPHNLRHAVRVLKGGGVIAHPADTCFGLAADLMNAKAVKKVQAIKGRDGKKPMSIMLPAGFLGRLEDYAVLDDFTRAVCKKLLPGPVTILLTKGPEVPPWYFPETDLIGIRIPDDELTQDLLNVFKGPLVTTSANASGCPICHTHEGVVECFSKSKAKPDLVLKGALPKTSLASTVIFLEKNRVRLVRPGPINAKALKRILGVDVVEF